MIDETSNIAGDLVVVLSDFHLGDKQGPVPDEFESDAEFEQLLRKLFVDGVSHPTTLVLAGDFIDFSRVLPELGTHGLGHQFGATEQQSLQKLRRVIDSHPIIFESLKGWLEEGHRVLVLAGNHDVDFYWPRVFEQFRSALGSFPPPQLQFVSDGYIHERGLYVEHGQQYTHDNRFEHWPEPILNAPDGPRLERPWGTLFMECVYNDIPELHRYIYAVSPRRRLVGALSGGLLSADRTSWRALSKISRFCVTTGCRPLWRRVCRARNAKRLRQRLRETDARIVVMGHTHVACDREISLGRGIAPVQFLNTGSWLPIFPPLASQFATWHDYDQQPLDRQLRYALINLAGSTPTAELKEFPATFAMDPTTVG